MVALTEANFPEVSRSLNFLYAREGAFTLALRRGVVRGGVILNELTLLREGKVVSSLLMPLKRLMPRRRDIEALLANDSTMFDHQFELD